MDIKINKDVINTRKYILLASIPMNGLKKTFISSSSFDDMETIKDDDSCLYKKGDTLYKTYDDNAIFKDEKLRNIKNLMIVSLDNFPKIKTQLIVDGQYNGYTMEYIKDSKTLKDVINDNTDIDTKLKYIKDIYKPIRELHQIGYVIGDVRLDNFICTSDKAYIIDLDDIRHKNEKFKNHSYYFVKYNNDHEHIIETENTDNIKACLASLSILYGENYEEIAKEYGINRVVVMLKNKINNPMLLNKIMKVLGNINGEVIYFDTVLGDIKKDMTKESKEYTLCETPKVYTYKYANQMC